MENYIVTQYWNLQLAIGHCDYLIRSNAAEARADVSLLYCRTVDDLSGEQRDNETRAARINNGNLSSVTRYLSSFSKQKRWKIIAGSMRDEAGRNKAISSHELRGITSNAKLIEMIE